MLGVKKMPDVLYNVRKTTDTEFKRKLGYLTSSMSEALCTCPRWGIVHSVLGKRFHTGYRQMALEAGSLLHDVFCGLNLLQVGLVQNLPDHMHFHAQTVGLFGTSRWQYIWKEFTEKEKAPTITSINALERYILAIIASSDFTDDPRDKNRTIANIERCAMELLQYWLVNLTQFDIYIKNRLDSTQEIGIEISLDAVFEILRPDGSVQRKIRCIGLADALYQNQETGAFALGEYKSASMMNEAWTLQFDTRHQITLYNALLQAYFGRQDNFKSILIGSAIPVRATTAPVRHFEVYRTQENVQELLRTYKFSQGIIRKHKKHPLEAPMFTHSCNRYFRPCSLMDLCVAAKEDQTPMLEGMQTEFAPSPSEQKAMLRNM